ncbi:hypothetical protein NBRC111894_524 [Sporolactobacillus inulinus]|uniref:Uncharacterized protein n=1 Tax=Sporolactobacillus inulinus TaxID=2078 RepID=A0A4Y3T3V7_9BACL|nr:hypothetical protein NBRC111894_524 [Sporolactobacillus inulinus]GEB75717.1 hypothetical protein SIN01_00620 [Sporolactobacillus inulinus]
MRMVCGVVYNKVKIKHVSKDPPKRQKRLLKYEQTFYNEE